jgi:hypothetical protein
MENVLSGKTLYIKLLTGATDMNKLNTTEDPATVLVRAESLYSTFS